MKIYSANWRRSVISLVGTILLGSAIAPSQEHIGQISQQLTTKQGVKYWTTRGNVVPVCWETTGYDREKQISKSAVMNSWGYWTNITFTGWGSCPTSGDAELVRIRIGPQGPENAGAGGQARIGEDALSKAADNSPGMNLGFDANVADQGRVEYVAIHEFGHILGFIHEQDAPRRCCRRSTNLWNSPSKRRKS